MSLLSAIITIFAWIALCFTVWAVGVLVANYRWRRFLKLLDERLGDRADGSRLTATDDLKLFHIRKDAP